MTVSSVIGVLVCFFAPIGFCVCAYWIGKAIPRTKKEKSDFIEQFHQDETKAKYEAVALDQLCVDLKPLLTELESYMFRPLHISMSHESISCFARDIIRGALKSGVEYKYKYEALQKFEDLELRKYCIEQVEGVTRHRIERGQELYEYLKTGNLPEKEKEEKE